MSVVYMISAILFFGLWVVAIVALFKSESRLAAIASLALALAATNSCDRSLERAGEEITKAEGDAS